MKNQQPESQPTQAAAPPVTPAKTAPQAEAPKTDPPKTEPVKTEPAPDAAKVIAEGRTHIDRANGAASTMLVTVYYADGLKNGESLQPVQIRVPATQSQIKVTAEQLVSAPEEYKLYSSVPKGTKVKSVNLDAKTGVATVDLSPEVQEVQGSAAASTIMAAFVYSLTEVPGVKAVQLWANGRPALLHGIEWSQPLTRDDMQARNLFQVSPVIKYAAKS